MKTKKLIAIIMIVIIATALGCKREALVNESDLQQNVISGKVKDWFDGNSAPNLNAVVKSIAQGDYKISKPIWGKT